MKTKHLAVIMLSSLLIVTVFAGLGGAKSLMDVFVTNTSDNPVPVDITDESIDVTLDEPIDVSGWLHTTQSDFKWLGDVSGWRMLFDIDTTGYRQITFGIKDYEEGCEISLDWYVHDPFSFAYDWSFTVGAEGRILYTHDIICDELMVWVRTTGASSTDVWAYYYMTT